MLPCQLTFGLLVAFVRKIRPSFSLDKWRQELEIDERLSINFSQQYAIVEGAQVTLTPTENRIMHIMYNNRGHVLSPGFLLTKAWDPVRKGTVESLWVHVRRLRSKIEIDANNPQYVVTVRGQGYCFPRRTSMARVE